jgi:hypothetical protein
LLTFAILFTKNINWTTDIKETKWQNTSMYRPRTSKQSFKEISLSASDHRRSTSGTKQSKGILQM